MPQEPFRDASGAFLLLLQCLRNLSAPSAMPQEPFGSFCDASGTFLHILSFLGIAKDLPPHFQCALEKLATRSLERRDRATDRHKELPRMTSGFTFSPCFLFADVLPAHQECNIWLGVQAPTPYEGGLASQR